MDTTQKQMQQVRAGLRARLERIRKASSAQTTTLQVLSQGNFSILLEWSKGRRLEVLFDRRMIFGMDDPDVSASPCKSVCQFAQEVLRRALQLHGVIR